MGKEKSLLRWGGLAGVLAGIIFIGAQGPLFALFPPPATPEGFPDVRAALAAGTGLAMAYAFLSIALVLALSRALRRTGLAAALFGSVLGVLGFLVTALGDASYFVAFAPISDLYHAPGVTPEEQATLVLLWQATQGLTDTFFFVGSLFLMIGFIALGVAMRGAPAFGSRLGGVSIVLGVAGGVGVFVNLFVLGVIGVVAFTALIFLLLFGWKVYSLSRAA